MTKINFQHTAECPYLEWAGAPYYDDGFIPPACNCIYGKHLKLKALVEELLKHGDFYPSAIELPSHILAGNEWEEKVRNLLRNLDA